MNIHDNGYHVTERFVFKCLAFWFDKDNGGILFINYLHECQLKLYRFPVHMEGRVARFLSFLVEK